MNFEGLLIGLFVFVLIGLFHSVVIKAEFYFSSGIWPVFMITGILFLLIALNIESTLISSLFSIVSFTCFWSIGELKEQEERVSKGWFPNNPDRNKTFKFKLKCRKKIRRRGKTL